MIKLLIGSKAISPFGAVGLLVRRTLREGIHEKYPSMENDIQRGGMASFLKDMSIEVGLLERNSSQQGLLRRRKMDGESDTSEPLLTVGAL